MNKWFSAALVVITLFSLGMAIQAQRQLRAARDVVSEDLSGNPLPDVMSTAAVPPALILPPAAEDDLLTLQRQVAALQAERDKLKFDLAAAQSALVSRAQNKTTKATVR